MNQQTILHSHCPACSSQQINKVITATDYTVTNQHFAIWECASCTLRFTQAIPTASEIGKYYQSENYISHSDTQKGLVARLYHGVRTYTLKQKKLLIQQITGLEKGNLLDIGTGTGYFSGFMHQNGWQVVALEPNEEARKKAWVNYQLKVAPAEELHNLPEASFQVITLWHVLEHVHDLKNYWQRFNYLLQSGGFLVIAVPNYTSADADFYQETWAAYDVPRHLYHFSPESIEKLATQYQFKLTQKYPMWFDSFYVSLLSEKYKQSSLALFKAFFVGIYANLQALLNKNRASSLIYVFQKQN